MPTRIKSARIANTESFTFGAANITGNLTVSSVTNLGNVGNVIITGGAANNVLRTDGFGNLSWVVQSGGGSDPNASNTANAAFALANSIIGYANNGATLSGSITPIANTGSFFDIIGITGDITIEVPNGTPYNGQKLIIRIKDNGTSRNVSWNAIYRSVGTTLPTTTIPNKTAYIGFVYNTQDVDWDAIGGAFEP